MKTKPLIAAIALALGLSTVAWADTTPTVGDSTSGDAQVPTNKSAAIDNTLNGNTADSNNTTTITPTKTVTITPTDNSTDTKTVDVAKDSNNTKTTTITPTDNSTQTKTVDVTKDSNNTATLSNTKTVDVTKDSNNTATDNSTDTKTVSVTKDSNNTKTVDVTKDSNNTDTKTVNVTKDSNNTDSSIHRTAVAKSDLSATVSGNNVTMGDGDYAYTTTNSVDNGSFTSSAGITTSAQNSGHNSLIQQTYTIQSNLNNAP